MTAQRVAILIHEGVQLLDVAGPADVFAEANGFIDAKAGYEIVLVAGRAGSVRATAGLRLSADLSVDEAGLDYHAVLVAGGPDLPEAEPDAAVTRWLRQVAEAAPLYGSICTGAFVLGHAGLLDGRSVTTHWQNAARLARMFPAARVEHDRIHIRDGRLVTSAGVTAGIDLALGMVAEAHGRAAALAVARRLVVVAQRLGGQSQFSPFLTAPVDERSPVARVQAHVMEQPSAPHGLEDLARIASMSPRNFTRLFFRETGTTPRDFVESARIDAARRLLEADDAPLKAIAWTSGFGGVDRMRAAFLRRLGVTPAEYRARFRMPEVIKPPASSPDDCR
ncbi:GlxA family transcriptional regulator [Tistrella mobilis]|uniref:GlxA family transcriptional regulator n=1 Tax=Tistrella mobilis TaxID=171437 RepID=UPI003555CC05